ncbi:major facilitator superfamily domain-containing protein 6-like [Adelges cooleyi]|uniref:major facilitator superfamily domain-containing protein 6-like n=1 Tax=Adelges cooleyi TaxID=133065 RepID=UPI00217FA119|nr:major facilitator superfamily domain-containing protein 6-like [Adelges cooleyi]
MVCSRINRELLMLKIHFFLAMGGMGSFFPFLPTIARQRGYSVLVAGMCHTLIPIPGLLLRPLIGAIADTHNCRRRAFILIELVQFIATTALIFVPGASALEVFDDTAVFAMPLFWMYYGVVFVGTFAMTSRGTLEDTISVNALGKDSHKYGELRVWGSIGWGSMSFLSGAYVDWFSQGQTDKDYTPAFLISMFCSLLDMYISSKIKIVQENKDQRLSGDFKKMFIDKRLILLLPTVLVFGFFVSSIAHYQFWYLEDLIKMHHPENKPWIKTIQGLCLSVQCFGGEIPLFFSSSFIIRRLGHKNIFSLSFFTLSLRLFLYSIIENPVWVLPVEVLHGITFALTFASVISYTAKLTPAGAEGTYQGFIGMMYYGIGIPLGGLVCAFSVHRVGIISTFTLLSIVAAIACITQIIINIFVRRSKANSIVKNDVEPKNELTTTI